MLMKGKRRKDECVNDVTVPGYIVDEQVPNNMKHGEWRIRIYINKRWSFRIRSYKTTETNNMYVARDDDGRLNVYKHVAKCH